MQLQIPEWKSAFGELQNQRRQIVNTSVPFVQTRRLNNVTNLIFGTLHFMENHAQNLKYKGAGLKMLATLSKAKYALLFVLLRGDSWDMQMINTESKNRLI